MANHTVLSAKEASLLIFRGKVGTTKLLNMGKRKEIPMLKIGGRYFFSQEDLQNFIANQLGRASEESERSPFESETSDTARRAS